MDIQKLLRFQATTAALRAALADLDARLQLVVVRAAAAQQDADLAAERRARGEVVQHTDFEAVVARLVAQRQELEAARADLSARLTARKRLGDAAWRLVAARTPDLLPRLADASITAHALGRTVDREGE